MSVAQQRNALRRRLGAWAAQHGRSLTATLGQFRRSPGPSAMTAAVIAIVTLGVVRFPVALAAAAPLGETGIWVAFAVSNVVGATLAYAWYRRGTWRDGDLTEANADAGGAGEVGTESAPTDD